MEKNVKIKTANEGIPTQIIIVLSLIVLFMIVGVVMCISRHEPISELFVLRTERDPFNPMLMLFIILFLDVLYLTVKYLIYTARKKAIIEKGTVHEGTFEDIHQSRNVMARAPSYNYRYTVRLDDGRAVETERYDDDYVSVFGFVKCSICEYNGRYYITDFVQRDRYI